MGDTIEIPLSRGKVALVDGADYELVRAFKWHAHQRSDNADKFYAIKTDASLEHLMHRLIMHPDLLEVDHINGDGLDNRRANLRLATRSNNQANSTVRVGISGYRGVYPVDGSVRLWYAHIKVGGHQIYLGSFDSKEDAAHCYDGAALAAFGEFARLNFPNWGTE